MTARLSLSERVRRLPLLVRIIAPVALAALVAWPLGGWDTVTLVSRTLPEYASNQTLDGHRFDIRVDDAWVTDVHPVYGPREGEQYLVVAVEATNVTTDAATSSDFDDYILPVIDGVDPDDLRRPTTSLALDHSALPELNPGLSRDLELVYTLEPGTVTPGDDLRIDLFDALPRNSFIGYGLAWDLFPAAYAIRNVDAR